MASARSDGDHFLCSICLTVFTKPVSTPCGHNFCFDCIADFWDRMTAVFPCPLCKEEFHIRPTLRVNTFIAEMTAHFQKGKSSAIPEQAGKVLCDVCTGERRAAALKSCLVCFMSYCETHLEAHQRISVLKKHKLTNPVENLESRICRKHDEPLGLFCVVDQVFVCDSCKDQDHKKHRIVTLEEMTEWVKTQLGKRKKDTNEMMQEYRQKIQEIRSSVEASRTDAGTVMSCSLDVMSALAEHIKRSQAHLTEVIETKQRQFEKEAHVLIKYLEVELKLVTKTNTQLDQVLNHGNPFTLHERFCSLSNTLQVKDWSGVNLKSDHSSLQGAIARLETTVRREVSTLCDPDLKEHQKHAVKVILDPDTANVHLAVSADGKQVAGGGRTTDLPNTPQRFAWDVPSVLAKEGFSSGKFYYEVQVKGRTEWKLGVVQQSIDRKGEKRLNPKTGYWLIWLRGDGTFIATEDPWVDLQKRETLQKVGVFVDCDGGQVSFYDADARVNIFTFTGYYFTEKLFPLFSLCSDTCRNSPLIITPVKPLRNQQVVNRL